MENQQVYVLCIKCTDLIVLDTLLLNYIQFQVELDGFR